MLRQLRFDRTGVALVLGLLALAPALRQSGADEKEDRAAIARQRESFLAAWLDDDQDGVMECFAEDAVLVPHAGAAAVATKEKIRAFYFSGPPMTIFEFTMRPAADASLNGMVAHEYGRYTLACEFEGDREPTRVEGNYVSIWKKGEDGVWRYALRTWNHG